MHYKKGDKVRVKKGCEDYCGSYYNSSGADYLVITNDDGYYEYDIFDRGGIKLESCVRCFKDRHLEPLTKDFSTIDTGDVIVSSSGNEYRILGRAGEVVFLEYKYTYNPVTKKEFELGGYTIKQPPIEPLELSVEEISKRLGYEVKIIKK